MRAHIPRSADVPMRTGLARAQILEELDLYVRICRIADRSV